MAGTSPLTSEINPAPKEQIPYRYRKRRTTAVIRRCPNETNRFALACLGAIAVAVAAFDFQETNIARAQPHAGNRQVERAMLKSSKKNPAIFNGLPMMQSPPIVAATLLLAAFAGHVAKANDNAPELMSAVVSDEGPMSPPRYRTK